MGWDEFGTADLALLEVSWRKVRNEANKTTHFAPAHLSYLLLRWVELPCWSALQWRPYRDLWSQLADGHCCYFRAQHASLRGILEGADPLKHSTNHRLSNQSSDRNRNIILRYDIVFAHRFAWVHDSNGEKWHENVRWEINARVYVHERLNWERYQGF